MLEQALAHETRRTFLTRITRTPGLTLTELAADAGLDPTTASYHARRLADAGLVVLVKDGRRCHCFLPGDARARAPPPLAVAALRALLAGAGTPAGLARALGVPRGTAGSILERLERQALVARAGGRWVVPARVARHVPEAFIAEARLGGAWSVPSSAR